MITVIKLRVPLKGRECIGQMSDYRPSQVLLSYMELYGYFVLRNSTVSLQTCEYYVVRLHCVMCISQLCYHSFEADLDVLDIDHTVCILSRVSWERDNT